MKKSKKETWQSHLDHLKIPFEIRNGKVYLWPSLGEFEYSKRKIWKLIRCQGVPGNKFTKHFHHRNNRRKTEELISKENFDLIPQNKMVDVEDSWNWD